MPRKKTKDESPPAAESPDKAAEPLPAEVEAPAEPNVEAVAAKPAVITERGIEPPADLGGYHLRGFWKGLPVHRCATCGYERVNAEAAVSRHAREDHAPAGTRPRASGLIGPSGKPLPSTQEG